MNDKRRNSKEDRGFSLVELLVAMAVGSIIIALIATAYWSQSQTSRTQQMTVEMQQNIRAGLLFMQQDIMMAGYEDTPASTAGATITVAQANDLQFTYMDPMMEEDNIDNDNDGLVDEREEKDGVDNNGDNDVDEMNELETVRFYLSGSELRRSLIEDKTNAVRQDEVIARDIEQLEFFYTLANGNTFTSVGTADNRNNIRKIGISILARTQFEGKVSQDNQTYTTLSGAVWGPYNDNNMRELVITTVVCRNMRR